MRNDVWFFAAGFLFAILIFTSLVLVGAFVPYWSQTYYATAVFSPDAQDDVLAFINSAQDTIDVEIYTFSSKDVADALIQKAQSGVKVRVLVELRTEDSDRLLDMVKYLQDGGVEVKFASKDFKLTHSKMAIVDGKRALVGSINFSNSALTKNREVAVILGGPIVSEFASVFESDWQAGVSAS